MVDNFRRTVAVNSSAIAGQVIGQGASSVTFSDVMKAWMPCSSLQMRHVQHRLVRPHIHKNLSFLKSSRGWGGMKDISGMYKSWYFGRTFSIANGIGTILVSVLTTSPAANQENAGSCGTILHASRQYSEPEEQQLASSICIVLPTLHSITRITLLWQQGFVLSGCPTSTFTEKRPLR
jgi:hypothetical protein